MFCFLYFSFSLFFSLFLSFSRLLSLFFSFSLVRSQKQPLPTIISCTHPKVQISHLSKTIERWLIWIIVWAHVINVRRVFFLGWLKMLKVCKERKREKERKLKILEHNFIQLECPGVQVFFLSFSFSLLFSCLLSKTPSPYNYFMHSPNYPDQPPATFQKQLECRCN